MNARDTVADTMMKAMNVVHKALLTSTGGRVGSRLGRMPTVELITVGRTTGKRRSAMLAAPVHGGGRFVLVASKGGDHRHPLWYLNLVANPDVTLLVDGATHHLRARTASAEEKAALWPDIVRAYHGYALYQRRTERDIPVILCEPPEA